VPITVELTLLIQLFQSPRVENSNSLSLAMALSSAFKERLDQMEFTRNQRLNLLQVSINLES